LRSCCATTPWSGQTRRTDKQQQQQQSRRHATAVPSGWCVDAASSAERVTSACRQGLPAKVPRHTVFLCSHASSALPAHPQPLVFACVLRVACSRRGVEAHTMPAFSWCVRLLVMQVAQPCPSISERGLLSSPCSYAPLRQPGDCVEGVIRCSRWLSICGILSSVQGRGCNMYICMCRCALIEPKRSSQHPSFERQQHPWLHVCSSAAIRKAPAAARGCISCSPDLLCCHHSGCASPHAP
jgi:hypothetical protein